MLDSIFVAGMVFTAPDIVIRVLSVVDGAPTTWAAYDPDLDSWLFREREWATWPSGATPDTSDGATLRLMLDWARQRSARDLRITHAADWVAVEGGEVLFTRPSEAELVVDICALVPRPPRKGWSMPDAPHTGVVAMAAQTDDGWVIYWAWPGDGPRDCVEMMTDWPWVWGGARPADLIALGFRLWEGA